MGVEEGCLIDERLLDVSVSAEGGEREKEGVGERDDQGLLFGLIGG